MDKYLFFLHIPKTAGTSLDTILKIEYKSRAVYPWNNVNFYGKIEEFRKTPRNATLKENTKVLKGHFFFGLHEYIEQDFTYTTFLREPMARVKSHLMQYWRMKNSLIAKAIEKDGVESVLEEFPFYGFNNAQSRWIAGLPSDTSINDEMLFNKCIKNFDKHFEVFGLTERFDESILWMHKAFSWRFLPYYSILNSTSELEKSSLNISPIARDRIIEMNQVDKRLYDYAKERFDNENPVNENDLSAFRSRLKWFQLLHKYYLRSKRTVKELYS